jgi:phosphatidylglycerophosphate synthase
MISQVVAISLLIVGYQLGEFRFVGKLALWVVMLFALVSGVDYFVKFSHAVLRPRTRD